jgi:hypothetical protein
VRRKGDLVAVILLIGLLLLGALLILRGPTDAEAAPVHARRDPVAPMVERGMTDIGVFLERHGAFAAYLERRDTSSGSTPE